MMTSFLSVAVIVALAVIVIALSGFANKETIRTLGRKSPDFAKLARDAQAFGLEADIEWLLGVKILGIAVCLVAFGVCMASGQALGMLFLLAALLIWKSTDIWIQNKEKQRQEQIEREFPLMVTLVRVYAQAADLYQALMIVRDALQGEMQRQVDLLAKELQVTSLQTALENFAERCRYPLLSNFVTVVLFGIQTGASVDDILTSFGARAYEARVNTIKRKIKAQPVLMAVIPAVLALSLIMLFIFPMYSTIIQRLQGF